MQPTGLRDPRFIRQSCICLIPRSRLGGSRVEHEDQVEPVEEICVRMSLLANGGVQLVPSSTHSGNAVQIGSVLRRAARTGLTRRRRNSGGSMILINNDRGSAVWWLLGWRGIGVPRMVLNLLVVVQGSSVWRGNQTAAGGGI
jgi:hypothetical protein